MANRYGEISAMREIVAAAACSDFDVCRVFFQVSQQRKSIGDVEIAEGLDATDLHVHVRMLQQIRQEIDNSVDPPGLHELLDRPPGGHRFIQGVGLLHAMNTFGKPVRVVGYFWKSLMRNFGAQLFQEDATGVLASDESARRRFPPRK